MKNTKPFWLLAPILFWSFSAWGQMVNLQDHAQGFNWLVGFEHAPGDERLYAVRKDGYVSIVHTTGTIGPQFLNLSSVVNNSWNNEHGLVGLAFHPDYQSNGYFYVFYNQIGTGTCTVARFNRFPNNPDFADPSSQVVLLTWEHPNPNHVGGCLKFGPDGYLYIASGDGGGAGDPDHNAQNLQSYLGKILRIDVDGGLPYQIPADNPFVGNPDALPAIWAYGLRNPWRFSFDRWTGDLWIADVGQDEREEVNFLAAGTGGGTNFGWSCLEGTFTYNAAQCSDTVVYTPPIYEYDHSGAECSITGGVVYRGGAYADLFGKYIFTDFCSGKIWALSKNGDLAEVVQMGNFNDNDFTVLDEDLYGELYVAGFYSNKILKIRSLDCQPVALITSPASTVLPLGETVVLHAVPGVPTMDYLWLQDGNPMPGQDSTSLTVSSPGNYSLIVTNPDYGCVATSNTIAIEAQGSLTISGPEAVCENTPVQYTVPPLPGANYFWTFSGASQVEGLGTHQLTVHWGSFQDTGMVHLVVYPANGAPIEADYQVVIHENDIVLGTAVTDATCFGQADGSVDLTVTSQGSQFTVGWSNGATTNHLSAVPAGSYGVTVTGDYGCKATATAMVGQPNALTATLVITHPTSGNSDGFAEITASGGTAPYTFLWSDGQMGGSASGLAAGSYQVTVSDAHFCSLVKTAELEEASISPTAGAVAGFGLRAFPNPFMDKISLEITAQSGQLEIVDVLGRQWFRREIGPNATGQPVSYDINTSTWPIGIYQLQFVSMEKTSVGSLVICHFGY